MFPIILAHRASSFYTFGVDLFHVSYGTTPRHFLVVCYFSTLSSLEKRQRRCSARPLSTHGRTHPHSYLACKVSRTPNIIAPVVGLTEQSHRRDVREISDASKHISPCLAMGGFPSPNLFNSCTVAGANSSPTQATPNDQRPDLLLHKTQTSTINTHQTLLQARFLPTPSQHFSSTVVTIAQ
jgi:hypothetical protein